MNKYKICDLIVKMNPKHEPLKTQLIPYLTDEENIDFEIPDISDKVEELYKERGYETIGLAEYMLYGAYFYTRLIVYEGVMLHSSAVVYEDKAYLFSAPSGTGKSTHTGLWLEVFDEAFILNDDKPAIRFIDGNLYAYGTPFSGKTDLNVPKRKLIQAICFIEQDKENWIKKATLKEAINNLYRETVRPTVERLVDDSFKTLEKIVNEIPIYKMGLTISKEAVWLAYNTMKESK